jgi:DNA-binding transcriptional LysR family regulator
MKFTVRQLEVFVAIARSGNVSRAAEEIPLSQSATSTALGEFERQFGLQLFDRMGKSLRLNEIGRQLLPRAVELLDRASGGRSGATALVDPRSRRSSSSWSLGRTRPKQRRATCPVSW